MLPTPVHVRLTYASFGHSPYMATFHKLSTELSRPTAPEKKGSQHNPQRATDQSADPYLASLPSQPMKQWGQSQASINGRLLGLLSPYHQYAIGTFNTCSRGPTERSLINTGGGATTLEVTAFHVPLPDLPDQMSPLSPSGPARSPFKQVLTTRPKC
jgi:hypothetical protein